MINLLRKSEVIKYLLVEVLVLLKVECFDLGSTKKAEMFHFNQTRSLHATVVYFIASQSATIKSAKYRIQWKILCLKICWLNLQLSEKGDNWFASISVVLFVALLQHYRRIGKVFVHQTKEMLYMQNWMWRAEEKWYVVKNRKIIGQFNLHIKFNVHTTSPLKVKTVQRFDFEEEKGRWRSWLCFIQ